jgi:beta-glucosidase
MKHVQFCIIALLLIPVAALGQKKKTVANSKEILPYQNPTLPIEQRVNDLLQRMTLDEKVAQLMCYWLDKKHFINNGVFDPAKAAGYLKNGIGEIARPNELSVSESMDPVATVKLVNAMQRYVKEQTRLGIPILFHEESLHGNQAKDATHFPSPLGMSSSWNEQLFSEVYNVVAKEVYARGARHVLAPVVDVTRDPRWGRTEETLGEDHVVVARLAASAIKSYQGAWPSLGKNKVATTLKHFGIHGQPEGGVNIGPVSMDERSARESLLYPFQYCVQNTDVEAIMPCYNELNSEPVHASRHYLTDVLRKQWGFKGLVVSDYFAIGELMSIHQVAADSTEAAYKSFKAGVDMELPDPVFYKNLKKLVAQGKITSAEIDSSVARVLRLKFKLGLFENPFADEKYAASVIGADEHRKVALKAAHQSIVLLKNYDNILPLDLSKYKNIAIIGPNADKCILGGYSNEPKQRVTPLQAFKEKLKGKANLLYAEGARITDKGDWFQDEVVLSSPAENAKRLAEAVKIAEQADVVLLFLGGNEATFREAWSKTHLGDLTSLDLRNGQQELIKAIAATGKPMIASVFSGPPMSVGLLKEKASALLQCWYLGQETGYAIADVILGDVNPSGKLTISIPRSTGHLPCYYNYKPSARRGYLFDSIQPLYPFGFGLSYTSFSYSAPQLSKNTMKSGEQVILSTTITNTGNRVGDEIVQLYIRDKVSNFTRPVKELKDFTRITLAPGASATVSFTITDKTLQYLNEKFEPIVEPGEFELMIGPDSERLQKVLLTVE